METTSDNQIPDNQGTNNNQIPTLNNRTTQSLPTSNTISNPPATSKSVINSPSSLNSQIPRSSLDSNDITALINSAVEKALSNYQNRASSSSVLNPNDYVTRDFLSRQIGATGDSTGRSISSSVSSAITTASTDYLSSSGGTVSGDLTSATLLSAPYFTATSATATSTFTGGLSVTGGGIEFGPNTIFYQDGQPFMTSSSTLYNTSVGYQALYSNTTGTYNTAIGYQSLYSNINAPNNTANGYQSLYSNIGGYGNVANGNYSLYSNTTGTNNTASGYKSLYFNTDGFQNTASGFYSLYSNTTGTNNIAIGLNSLRYNSSATSSTAIGAYAGYGVSGQTYSQNNVFLGYQSGYRNTTGNNNTLLGYQSGYNLADGSSNILIGYNVNATSSTATGQLNIGNVLFGTGMYDGATVSGTAVAGGMIGIGVSTPAHALDVYGDCISWNGTCINTTAPSNTVSYVGTTFQFSEDSTITTAVSRYMAYAGGTIATTDIAGVITTRAGILQNFYVSADANTWTGTTAFEVLKNGVSTGYIVTLVAAGTSASDTTSTLSVAAGDRLSLKVTTAAGSGTLTRPKASFEELVTTNVFSSQWITSGNDITYNTGNVGIGTTSPYATLSVTGATSASTTFAVYGFNSQTAPIALFATTTGTATSTALIIDSNGQVGIATTSPWKTFSVNGTMAFTGLTTTGGTQTLCLDANNQVVTNAAGACTTSSSLMKHDIEAISLSGLDIVNSMKPSIFTYNTETSPRWGFIAEDLSNIDKHLISYYDSNNNPVTIDTTAILAASVKAIQEQQKQITELNTKYSALASSTTSLTETMGAFTATSTIPAITWNVDELAITLATTTADTLSKSSSFIVTIANAVRDMIAGAGDWVVQKITATSVETQTLCVGKTCVNEDQLKAILQKESIVPTVYVPTPTPTPSPTPELTPTPNTTVSTSTPDSNIVASSTPTVSPTPTPTPSPTIEATSTPSPTSEITPTPTVEVVPTPEPTVAPVVESTI